MRFFRRVLLLAPLFAGLHCSLERPFTKPHLFILLVDTLRADHLGHYGYARPTSPNIDRLARRGLTFMDATSSSSWTLPAVASLFTALYPGTHGLDSDAEVKKGMQPTLSRQAETLAGALSKAGYATAAVTTNVFLNPRFEVTRGFHALMGGPLNALEVSRAGLDLAGQAKASGAQPMFIYLHYNDVHGPYCPPAPYDGLHKSSTRRLLSPDELDHLGYLRRSGSPSTGTRADYLERYIDLYDGSISYVDAAVGAFLDGLDSLGLSSSSLVLLLSDHGEEFLEHDGFDHGYTLYDEVLRIPMIAAWPGHLPRGRRVAGTMNLVDVMPTLLDLFRLPKPAGLEGQSRAGQWPQGKLGRLATYAELNIRGPYRLAERTPDAKWILDGKKGEMTERYDLKQDPGERRNLINESGPKDRKVAARLASFLSERSSRRRQFTTPAPMPLDESVQEALQGLGYIN